jgi:hypothetical protein
VTEWSLRSEFAGCGGHAFPAGRVPSNIVASRLMDFDLIASEYARHRKIMLPVLDGLRDFVAGIDRKGAVLELGSGTGRGQSWVWPPTLITANGTQETIDLTCPIVGFRGKADALSQVQEGRR